MIETVAEAYRCWLEMAGAGRDYVRSEVLRKFEGDPNTVMGRGFDIERPVMVMDQLVGQTVAGTGAVRVLQIPAVEPVSVLLRVRLDWQRSDGGRHVSTAVCRLTPERAGHLDESGEDEAKVATGLIAELHRRPETTDQIEALMEPIYMTAKAYDAVWHQDWPDHGTHRLPSGAWDAIAIYHARTVARARTDYPELLGLLSGTFMNIGRLAPAELIDLGRWLQDNRR